MSRTVKTNILLLILALVIAAGALFVFMAPAKQDDGDAIDSAQLEAMTAQTEPAEDETEVAAPAPSWEEPTGFDPYSIRAIGNPDALVKIVEFSSLTCGHCAHFHRDTLPELKKNYIDTGKVYYVFNEFPLNAPALAGVLIARCLPIERYYPFVNYLFSTLEKWGYQDKYLDALKQNAKLVGAQDEQIEQCLNDEKLRTVIAGKMEEASKKHKINATPSFVINDSIVIRGAYPYKVLSKIVDEELAKTTADLTTSQQDK